MAIFNIRVPYEIAERLIAEDTTAKRNLDSMAEHSIAEQQREEDATAKRHIAKAKKRKKTS